MSSRIIIEREVSIRRGSEPGPPALFRALFDRGSAIATSAENLALDEKVLDAELNELLEVLRTEHPREVDSGGSGAESAPSPSQFNPLRESLLYEAYGLEQFPKHGQRIDHLRSQLEELPEFSQLERELLDLGLGVETNFYGDDFEVMPRVPLGALFDCLGVYHDILRGESCDAVWARIETALQRKPTEVTTLVELIGCDFPGDFEILNSTVLKMSKEKWLELVSRGDALNAERDHYIRLRRDGRWYLERTTDEDRSFVSYLRAFESGPVELPRIDELPAELRGLPLRKKKVEAVVWTGRSLSDAALDTTLAEFWPELLMLALSHPGCFNVGETLASVPGAGVDGVQDEGSDEREPPRYVYGGAAEECYRIEGADRQGFQDFVKLITSALRSVVKSRSCDLKGLADSAPLYVRWRLTDRPGLNPRRDPNQYNEVLLHYVVVLEKLTMLPQEKRDVSPRLIDRVAYLVGRNDNEINGVAHFVKRVYDERSQVVHRRHAKAGAPQIDLHKLRDICRRAMASALIIAGRSAKENYLEDFLDQLVLSGGAEKRARRTEAQKLARDVAVQIGSLTRCLWIGKA
jgi:hypothetical protein